MNLSLSSIRSKLAASKSLSLAEAEFFVTSSAPRTPATVFRGDAGFQKSSYFLGLLNNPQNATKTIHIAGTSGKGSVAQLTTQLLLSHGFTVGTYTSPHVYNLRERWQINGSMIPLEILNSALIEIYPALEKMRTSKWGAPTYFELTTAIGFVVNRLAGTDYAVVETGFGGLLDTTNTISRKDKLAIITQLGLDHTEILGKTLPEIAFQKSGILPFDGMAVILKNHDTATWKIIQDTAAQRNTQIYESAAEHYQLQSTTLMHTIFDYHSGSYSLHNLTLSLIGAHQAQNAALTLLALEKLASRDGFAVQESAVRQAFTHTKLPGRFERRTISGTEVILDGAHNPQKLGALVQTLQQIIPGRKFIWVMAFGKNKDALESFKLIAPLVELLYVTTFFANQDVRLSSASMPVHELAETARAAGISNILIKPDNHRAVLAATEQFGPIIITGSFYLVGEMDALKS